MKNKFHPFHMITLSPWPIISSFAAFTLTSLILVFTIKSTMVNVISILVFLFFLSMMWWKSVVLESSFQGFHHTIVIDGLKMGMILFIVSEVFFFLSFFWSYFHSSISPTLEIGQIWPPYSINSFNPMNVPLLNTIILLSSGVTVTWAHHLIMVKSFKVMNLMMMLTCLLGVYFTLLQYMEYNQASFSMGDSIYGSIFFMATGFHGIHVLIGTTFLLITLVRMSKVHLNSNHFIGFEMAAWYWHFVDVVWLFLYVSVYWWGY